MKSKILRPNKAYQFIAHYWITLSCSDDELTQLKANLEVRKSERERQTADYKRQIEEIRAQLADLKKSLGEDNIQIGRLIVLSSIGVATWGAQRAGQAPVQAGTRRAQNRWEIGGRVGRMGMIEESARECAKYSFTTFSAPRRLYPKMSMWPPTSLFLYSTAL